MNRKELIEKLRQKYSLSPPDGMTRQDILHMTDGDLLDMDYFLNTVIDVSVHMSKDLAHSG